MCDANYTCGKCKASKPESDFGKVKGKVRSYCKACHTETEKKRRAANLDKFRSDEKRRRLAKLDLYKARERRASHKRSMDSNHAKRMREAQSDALKKQYEVNHSESCPVCGIGYCPLFGKLSWKTKCPDCSNELEAVRLRCKRAMRRAMVRGANADRIDPIKVFERDNWICHLCGKKTKPALRGKHDALAPELDHVVTLADGGSHTWGNVACSCRKCNNSKSGKSLGQIGFSIFC